MVLDEVYWGKEAAGVLCVTRGGDVLMALRGSRVMEPNTWGVIGGKLEYGEDPKRAAEREFREETQYRGSMKMELVHTFHDRTADFKYHNFVGLVPDRFDVRTDWETAETRWVNLDRFLESPAHWAAATGYRLHFGLKELVQKAKSKLQKYAVEEQAEDEGEDTVCCWHVTTTSRAADIVDDGFEARSEYGGKKGVWISTHPRSARGLYRTVRRLFRLADERLTFGDADVIVRGSYLARWAIKQGVPADAFVKFYQRYRERDMPHWRENEGGVYLSLMGQFHSSVGGPMTTPREEFLWSDIGKNLLHAYKVEGTRASGAKAVGVVYMHLDKDDFPDLRRGSGIEAGYFVEEEYVDDLNHAVPAWIKGEEIGTWEMG